MMKYIKYFLQVFGEKLVYGDFKPVEFAHQDLS
jgi:hypothetical protein